MERVTFLVGDSERLGCMLNPDSLVLRRHAGVKPLESVGGFVAGTGLADVPLLYTNGGYTELSLDLLFDVTIPGSSVTSADVRDLTRPLWNLSENVTDGNAERPLRTCVLLWGKAMNFPGVITSIAERLEYFTPDGFPRRSWLRLVLRRVSDNATPVAEPFAVPPEVLPEVTPGVQESAPLQIAAPEAGGTTIEEAIEGEESLLRIDQFARCYLGSDRLWRSLAAQYGIDNPMEETA